MKVKCLGKIKKHLCSISPVLGFIMLFYASHAHGQVVNSNAVPVLTAFTTAGFEVPTLSTSPGYVTAPTNVPGWAFTGNAGVSKNGTAFTVSNPPAPQGDQVLFIQIAGTASANFTPATAGFYRINLFVAKRANGGGNQRIAVEIDGVVIDTVTPTTTTYINYKSTVKLLSAGTHNLTLRGLSPFVDNTAFVDNVRYEKVASWSSPSSWSTGVVPGVTNDVVIDANEAIVLDVNATVKSLQINGNFVASRESDLSLGSNWIMTSGSGAAFDWGTASAPYKKKGTIRLLGSNTGTDVNGWGAGEKFLATRDFATIDIHGEAKPSWTQLGTTANKNATTITLKETMPWSVGDSIVITSTDFDPYQAEQRAIIAISGTTITLSNPLNFMHYGATETYNGLTLDERAEVGLLSRNIRIVGDNPGPNGFGGHCHFQTNSQARFSGVELYNMGQKGILGRYPFHWHHLHDISNMYFRNNSVVKSFNRVLAIHESNNGRIENNVAYDHIGHGFYLEDNVSTRNVFYHNLGVLTRVPAAGQNIEPHDRVTNPNTAEGAPFVLPATFWINHPDNDFIENVAAGSDGTGFWYLGQNQQKLGANTNNRSHSNTYNITFDGNIDGAGNLIFAGFVGIPGQPPTINSFSSFKARERGLWTRSDLMYFDNARLGDCPRNTFFASNQQLRGALIVGKSLNVGNPLTGNEIAAGRSLGVPSLPATDELNIFYGHSLYDGPSGISNVTFAKFSGNNSYCFSIFAAAVKSPVHWAQGITFDATVDPLSKFFFNKVSAAEFMYSSGLIDRDGSLTGTANAVITPKIESHPSQPNGVFENTYNRRPDAVEQPTWGAYVNIGSAPRLNKTDDYTFDGTCYSTYQQYAIRSNGGATIDFPTNYACTVPAWRQNPVFVNDTNYRYYYQRHKIPFRIQTILLFGNSNDYMISIYPNMPSGTFVYGDVTTSGATNTTTPLPKAASYDALKTASGQAYYIANNTLYLKQVATVPGETYTTTPFGHDKKSTPINICQQPNCLFATQTQEKPEVTLADFELGPDSRVSVSKSGTLALPTLSYDATALSDPNDGINSKVSWTITKAGISTNYVDVNINFPRQIWREFNYIKFNYSGATAQVIVHDNGNGDLVLGTINPGGAVNLALNSVTNAAYLDNVVGLTLRVRESDFASPSTTMNLFNIALSVDFTSTISSAEKEIPNNSEAVNNVLNERDNEIKVYPMPFDNILNVQLGNEANYTVTIYDIAGKVMRTVKSEGNITAHLDLSNLSSGVYLMNIESIAGRKNVKIIKD